MKNVITRIVLLLGALALVGACGGNEAAPGPTSAAGQTTSSGSDAGATKGRFNDAVLDACLDRLDPAFQNELQNSQGPYDINVTLKGDAAAARESYKAVTRDRIRELCNRTDVVNIWPSDEHRGH